MKIKITLLLLFMISNCFSQNNFEKGFFININGEKIECFIKNEGWQYIPKDFKYQITKNDEIIKMNVSDIKELEVSNFHFKKFIVDIDKSSDNLEYFSDERVSKFEKDTLLLRNLVNGKASLYIYSDKGLKRFFYSLDNSNPKQLEFKYYKKTLKSDNHLKINVLAKGINDNYKYQLKKELFCDQNTSNIEYKQNDLTKYFVKYNVYSESDYTVVAKNKNNLNLYIKGGVGFSSLTMKNGLSPTASNFKNNSLPNFGLEFEFILPTYNNKWSIFAEALYLGNFKGNSTFETSNGILSRTNNFEVNFNSIDFSVGLKHYFFLNNNSKLLLGLGYNLTQVIDGNVTFETGGEDFTIKNLPQNTLLFTFGYMLNNKITLELKHQIYSKNIVTDSQQIKIWESEFTRTSLLLSYKLF